MASSVNSPADLVNLTLARIGYKKRIGSLYDGSEAAVLALTLYAQTRDELLRQYDWDFAERQLVMTLLKSAPAGGYVPGITNWTPASNPPMPFLYEYAYPGDCLMMRAIRPALIFQPVFVSYPNVFDVANDSIPLVGQTVAPGRVILCYLPNAIGTYCGQVADMSQWDVGFVEAMIDRMAAGLAPALARVTQAGEVAEKGEGMAAERRGVAAVGRQG